jgi:drug/metabolite transporter (DMT)-like permease
MDIEINKQWAVGATIIAAILWSTGGMFVKLLSLDAFNILFYRSLYAALTFVLIFRGRLLKVNKLSLVSIFFYAPLLITFVHATKLTSAANAIFLQYTAPAFILILEPWLTRKRISKRNLITVILCMTGMSLFFMHDFSSAGDLTGTLLALAGGVVLTGLLLSQRLNDAAYQPGAVFWGNILVCMVTLPWALQSPFPVPDEQVILATLGIGQLGLGFAFFVYGQKHLPAIESALISMLEPILNPLWVMLLIGEIPGIWSLAGGALILITLTGRMLINYYYPENQPR